jgi:predicted RNA-binding Zn-ribbon protein involved in translation (DUF1610 family)
MSIAKKKNMSDRQFFCKTCGVNVGIIRDARLMKGVTFQCPKCSIPPKQKFNADTFDMFKDLFDDLPFSNKKK